MISDYWVPAGIEPLRDRAATQSGQSRGAAAPATFLHASWSAESIARLANRLAEDGTEALGRLSPEALSEAWCSTIDEFLDPQSPGRRSLDPALASACRLTPPALEAALEAMLTGFTGAPARRLIDRSRRAESRPRGLAVAILAANVPGLAVQVVLPALVAHRPLIVKSSSRESFFTAALVRSLAERSHLIAEGLAAVTWHGGDAVIEAALLEKAERLVAYGHAETLDDLRSRYRGHFTGLGPRLSIGIVSRDADFESAGRALARDVALFEQRGCLSVQAVFTDGEPRPLAAALAEGLRELADRWPPPAPEPEVAARIQQLRQLADLAGEFVSELPVRTGTVVTATPPREPAATTLRPMPGGRAVLVQPVRRLEDTEIALRDWEGAIQGAALAGSDAWRMATALETLGLTRFAKPGELQFADALWANGEQHLVDFFSG